MAKKSVLRFFIALAAAVALTFALILIFAGVVKLFTLPDVAVKIVNQLIKIIGVSLCTLLFVRDGKAALKGAGIGLAYGVVCYVLISLCGHGFTFGVSTVLDLIFTALFGALVAVIKLVIKQ